MNELKADFRSNGKHAQHDSKLLKSDLNSNAGSSGSNSADNASDIIKSLVRFDRQKNAVPTCQVLPGHLVNFDSQKTEALLNPVYPPDATLLIPSDAWIKKFGLKSNKLTFENILSMIGFKQPQDYLSQLKRNVSSVYSSGLFLQTSAKNGATYNVSEIEAKFKT